MSTAYCLKARCCCGKPAYRARVQQWDIDFLRQGSADRHSLIALVRDCLAIDGAADGVEFDSNSIAAEDIAKDSNYLRKSMVGVTGF
jgi:hypothetical protein